MRYVLLLALVFGCGNKDSAESKAKPNSNAELDLAMMTAKKYAFEAYPTWAMAHPDKACPDKLAELDEHMGKPPGNDPWGNAYVMYCGRNLPPSAKGLAISSNGPDGKPNTPDDIQSWK